MLESSVVDHSLGPRGELGLVTRDIKYVIHTHMHWDHTGGNRF